jgi:hypothetical protein
VAAAHERCPYSNATRGNIDVDIQVTGGDQSPTRAVPNMSVRRSMS